MKLVPKRRFKGFSGEWGTSNLGNLASFSKGKGYSRNDLTETGVPIILYGSLYTNYQTVIEEVNTFVDEAIDSVYSTGNEVIVPSSGETKEDIARASALRKPGVILGGDLNIIHPNTELDAVFLALSLSSGTRKKQLAEKATGASVVHLYNTDLQELDLPYPSKKEQIQIATLFQWLDKDIIVEQEKLKKFQALKQAYLHEMFPGEGKNVPKRRFAGFTGVWKRCKLKDAILSELKGKAKAEMRGTASQYLDVNYLNGGPKSYVDFPQDVEKDDVLIIWDGSQAGSVYHGFEGALGSTLKAYKPKYSGEFLYQFLKKNQALIFGNYRTPNIPHVINTFTDEFYICLPCPEEQKKIGEFFKQIDNLIAVQQAKVEKLKAMKSAYLNEMFV
jgi:type I restriction enzyme S subunit